MASFKHEAEPVSAVSKPEINPTGEVAPPVEIHETAETQSSPVSSPARSVVRVSLDKLDELVKIVSDLVISRSVFEQRLFELEQQNKELHNSTRRLQSSTTKLENSFEADMLGGNMPDSRFQMSDSRFQIPGAESDSFGLSSSFDFDTLEFDRYTVQSSKFK